MFGSVVNVRDDRVISSVSIRGLFIINNYGYDDRVIDRVYDRSSL